MEEALEIPSEFLQPLQEEWQPLAKPARLAWLAFYGLFLGYALTHSNQFLLTDYIFLPIHEGGHLLFGWLGQTLGIMGGTLLQLGVPLALAVYFVFQRQIAGTAFATFLFFENFLNVATYMADARRQALPLVTVGDSENVEHDWLFIFSKLGVLQHDMGIAAATRLLGWLGMLGVIAWLWWRTRRAAR